MKKIFCKFLSIALLLINLFEFFTPQYVFAVKTSDILRDDTSTENCLQTMEFLNSYLEKNAVPTDTRISDVQLADNQKLDILWGDIEAVGKALSLIFYKILLSPKKQTSSDTTFFGTKSYLPDVILRGYINRFLKHSSPGGVISQATVISTLMFPDEILVEVTLP